LFIIALTLLYSIDPVLGIGLNDPFLKKPARLRALIHLEGLLVERRLECLLGCRVDALFIDRRADFRAI
jgi:hypothetical protein